MDAVQIIAAKRDGEEIPDEALRSFVLGYSREEVPDGQMSAFLMAGCLRGFSEAETFALTSAMLASGETLDLSALSGPTVDKHSTGGVGDGTTLIVAPLAAELGMQIVKLSGRGLGHTGGTLDKLGAIPGMRTELSGRDLIAQVSRIGLAVCGQTADLVPADRAMYALRDVTATVPSAALIASSIMSKKLAGGAAFILLDVKVGSGAFMAEIDSARELGQLCVALGARAKRTTSALISDMNQPLGDMIGNAIEVREAIETLRGQRQGRLLELSLQLVAHLAALSGVAPDAESGYERATRALTSGGGLERLGRLIEAQGGDPRVIDDTKLLPQPGVTRRLAAERDGWLATVDTQAIGHAAADLGAGRHHKQDTINPAVGIELQTKIGDQVQRGGPIACLLADDENAADAAASAVLDALVWSEQPVEAPALIHDVIAAPQ